MTERHISDTYIRSVLFNRGKNLHSWLVRGLLFATLEGTLRSDDAIVTRTSKKQKQNEIKTTTIGLESKTQTLHVHHTFLYISLTFLHDHDVKLPNFIFYGRSKQATTKFYFIF